MLDIVRIRKEGYPVHVSATEFLSKYRCLAAKDRDPLPADEKKAAAKILHSLNLPETEWQIGRSKIFLRISVFDPLEDKRKALITDKMILIQKTWKGFIARRRFKEKRRAAIVLQKRFRGIRQRMKFLRKKRATIIIQSYYRGMAARELAAALRKKKEEEEAEKRRLKKLEEEKQAKLNAQKSMDESYKAAQLELFTLAKLAEHKSQKAVTKSGDVDLDQMFNFLSQDTKPVGKTEQTFLMDITDDLEAMFKKGQVDSEPKRTPARKAPLAPVKAQAQQKNKQQQPKAANGSDPTHVTSASLSRTQRRQRRVNKKLLGVEEEASKRQDAFDPEAYPLVRFAEMYFNDFPRDTAGFSTISLRRAPKVNDPLPKAEMMVYTKSPILPTSMVHMHDPENVNLACGIFKDMCKLLRGELKPEQYILVIQSTVAYGIERAELRDEIFCQLIRQVSNNPKQDAIMRGWHFLTLCTIAFPPSKNFNKVNLTFCDCNYHWFILISFLLQFLQAFYHRESENMLFGKYAAACLRIMRRAKVSARKFPPSTIEIAVSCMISFSYVLMISLRCPIYSCTC